MCADGSGSFIYADGELIASYVAITTVILEAHRLLAVEVSRWYDFGGLAGSFSDGRVTDASWKCSSQKSSRWYDVSFDDNAWKPTNAISRQQKQVFCLFITPAAQWLWMAKSNYRKAYGQTIYCRKRLCKHNSSAHVIVLLLVINILYFSSVLNMVR